jgi:chromosome partitioning protein
MPVFVVANPKGGTGKSTLATNLAGWLARQGHAVALGDLDRQQSARQWLALRPPQLPPIRALELAEGDVLKVADRIVVPLQPSPFDLAATHAFLQALASHKRGARLAVGLVAMRVKEHTHATQHLHEFLAAVAPAPLNVPIAHLRDTQNYAHLAARGLTLFDVAPGRVERDLQQWLPLTDWLQA